MLVLTILAWAITPYFYAIMLLDIVKRSRDLQNVVQSITKNFSQMIITFILGVVVLYILAVIGFQYFNSQFIISDGTILQSDMYADTLYYAFLSTFCIGWRAGGGIGDVLQKPLKDKTVTIASQNGTIIEITKPNTMFWTMYVYTIFFWIFMNILFINLIFGIIIDTFGSLRDDKTQLEEDINQHCYICGISSYEFETKGHGWYNHIYLQHYVYDYINFLIYIDNKEFKDCSGVEKFVKEKIKKEALDISFFPLQKALDLPDREISS